MTPELLVNIFKATLNDDTIITVYTNMPAADVDYIITRMYILHIPLTTDTIAGAINYGNIAGLHSYIGLTQAQFDSAEKAYLKQPLNTQKHELN